MEDAIYSCDTTPNRSTGHHMTLIRKKFGAPKLHKFPVCTLQPYQTATCDPKFVRKKRVIPSDTKARALLLNGGAREDKCA